VNRKDVIILGGGAAGLMCALEAGKRGRKVLVLERAERLGKKILISGGGRCNFTNLHVTAENYVSGNPHFCKSALARFTPDDFIALVEKHRIAYHEKKLGQLFCDFSSRQIVELLQKECTAASVEVCVNSDVRHVTKGEEFEVAYNDTSVRANALVVATGGVSFPKLGATDFGYRIADQFGIKMTERRPGLVPLTFSAGDRKIFGELAGVSLDAIASSGTHGFRENILFTHRGLSGPAVLQISNYWQPGTPVRLNLLPTESALEVLQRHRGEGRDLAAVLSAYLPRRFVQAWIGQQSRSLPMAQYSANQVSRLARSLDQWEIMPEGTEGYEKAEVTLGGIDTSELSSKTMEARKVSGLFFIGEVVDVTGWLGGYNFQWAWASGHAAGQIV